MNVSLLQNVPNSILEAGNRNLSSLWCLGTSFSEENVKKQLFGVSPDRYMKCRDPTQNPWKSIEFLLKTVKGWKSQKFDLNASCETPKSCLLIFSSEKDVFWHHKHLEFRLPASKIKLQHFWITKTSQNHRFFVDFRIKKSKSPVKHFSVAPTQLLRVQRCILADLSNFRVILSKFQ